MNETILPDSTSDVPSPNSDHRVRVPDPSEMAAISRAHALLTNMVLAWNTTRIDSVVVRLKRDDGRGGLALADRAGALLAHQLPGDVQVQR
jgi:hypothetical protein